MSDAEQQQTRQILLDSLYMADGRNNPAHPMHNLYTGLVASQPQPLTEDEIREAFLAWWRESYPTPPGPHAITTHVAFAHHLLSTHDPR